mmetsp:Transcript_46845/g.109381  ORF Transcript_46845/g.109381 Transcript_46845/m.109381 type:complete len:301 (+) Transcript_46845:26-928(+)
MSLRRSKLDKNSVYYRFAHKSQVLEKIEFYGKEIAIGDLRHTIAEKQKLPKVDLQILNESTGEVYTRDGHLLRPNVIVTVRRTPIQTQKKPAVLNLEGADILSRVKRAKIAPQPKPEPVPEEKAPCPPEYLCSLCTGLFENPSIAPCCGRSACLHCFEAQPTMICPLCKRQRAEDEKPLPNPRLADIIASLNLDFFELPAVTVARQAAAVRAAAQSPAATAPATTVPPALAPPVETVPAVPVQAPVSTPPAPPANGMVMPAMLSKEQFYAWQQSLMMAKSRKDGNRDRRRRRRRSPGSSE